MPVLTKFEASGTLYLLCVGVCLGRWVKRGRRVHVHVRRYGLYVHYNTGQPSAAVLIYLKFVRSINISHPFASC